VVFLKGLFDYNNRYDFGEKERSLSVERVLKDQYGCEPLVAPLKEEGISAQPFLCVLKI
jgi:hypothetical protein